MSDRAKFVRTKWQQVVIPFSVAFVLALGFLLFALVAAAFGKQDYAQTDLFKFCLVLAGFGVPFLGFVTLIKFIVLSLIEKSSRTN